MGCTLLLIIIKWPFPVIPSIPFHPQPVPRRRIGNTPPGPREHTAISQCLRYKRDVLPAVVVEGTSETTHPQLFWEMAISELIAKTIFPVM